VAQIAGSIQEFGFTNPVLIDGENGIIAGHGRVMAASKLKLKEVPTICLGHLSAAQKKAYIIADNKLALNAGWDEELLGIELSELRELDFDLALTGFDKEELNSIFEEDGETGEDYSQKIDAPVYEPKGEKPRLTELIDQSKKEKILARIEKAEVSESDKIFLRSAAERHAVFNYGKIAEYYCHADPGIQELMEESALVIIDFNSAMKNGYVKLKKEIAALAGGSSDDE
jgi:hypothetical protein